MDRHATSSAAAYPVTEKRPHQPPAIDDREVAQILDDFLRRTGVPGVAASLFTSTGLVAQAARGVSSIESPGVAMTPRTVGAVYSLTKVMTATALGALAARQRVDLDEPIARHLPATSGRERFETTTLRHLLSHSAGLERRPVPVLGPISAGSPIEQYVVSACLGARRFAEPGEVFGYSDAGIIIAGYVLERITGTRFTQAMRELLFAPAGMLRTTTDPMVAMTFPLSQGHTVSSDGRLAVRRRFDANPMSLPSDGAFSCTEDLARLGVVHLRGDAAEPDRQVITPGVIKEIHTPYVDVGLEVVQEYGLAVATGPRYGPFMSVGHEAFLVGNWSKLQLIPDQGIGVAWLDNRGDHPELRRQRYRSFGYLMNLLGAGPRSWQRDNTTGDRSPSALSGVYRRPTGRPITISAAPAGLRASDGLVTVDYQHLTGPVFVATAETKNLPARIPWAPSDTPCRDSPRSALCVVGPADAPTHVLLNGLPYQRSHSSSVNRSTMRLPY